MYRPILFIFQVYLSTRRGSWIVNRIWKRGLPLDYTFLRRFNTDIEKLLPESFRNSVIERRLNSRFDHAVYGLKPKHRVNAQHIMINDELPNQIAAGNVVIKVSTKMSIMYVNDI